MALTLDQLEALVKKEGLKYFKAPDRPILRLGIRGMFGRFEFLMLLELDGTFLQFRTINLLQCPKSHPHFSAVLQTLAKINNTVRLLKMGWNESGEEIVGFADTWIVDGTLTQEQFSRNCGNFCSAVDINARRIKETMETGKDPGQGDPEEVLAALDDEDMPEALRKLLAGLREKLAKGKKKKKKVEHKPTHV